MYLQKGATLKDAAAKKEAFMMADAAYADLENQYVDAQEYVNFMRARVNLQLDPEQKQGLAKPYYEKLIELIAPKAEKSKSDITRLTESYRCLISYYLVANDDNETAKSFATKLKEIDPENEIAKQVLEMK
jgi:3-methyladenine DNA glycosylase/8-oxoguanine DNA glycosylase